jgi:hypothetical protein
MIERYNDKEIISPQSGDAAKPQFFFYRYIVTSFVRHEALY